MGNVFDAEDATQEILLKAMTNLSSFKQYSRFSTWVYRIAINYLINNQKKRSFKEKLTFDLMAEDLEQSIPVTDENYFGLEEDELAEELKLSCTNIMLQCLSPQDRCVFILGTMFKMNSRASRWLTRNDTGSLSKRRSYLAHENEWEVF
ncbi:MAG: RNA polymerase sigma factor [Enterococcus raffinosus]